METVEHMARNTGGARSRNAGLQRAEKVETMETQPGTIALQIITQGTTSHARTLVKGGVRISFGATPLTGTIPYHTIGTTAVQKLWSLS